MHLYVEVYVDFLMALDGWGITLPQASLSDHLPFSASV